MPGKMQLFGEVKQFVFLSKKVISIQEKINLIPEVL